MNTTYRLTVKNALYPFRFTSHKEAETYGKKLAKEQDLKFDQWGKGDIRVVVV